jgi:hypothetical protein
VSCHLKSLKKLQGFQTSGRSNSISQGVDIHAYYCCRHQPSFTEELLKITPHNRDTPNITYRILRRANIIIEAVRAHKVIDDLTKLMKVSLGFPVFRKDCVSYGILLPTLLPV